MSNVNVPVSILELATIQQDSTIQDTFKAIRDVAQQAEQLGYKRYWLAEHHNMVNVASSATAVLIGYIAANTQSIQVGSGGIMLPNHAPLIVAEQFGTLASIYPNRINLGLGRAPGTDQLTAYALRRDARGAGANFPLQVEELLMYFSSRNNIGPVRAIPGEGITIPVWILGSSTDSAYFAAELGLPYAFASHFAPTQLHRALSIYRENFKPSERLSRPYTMACVNVVAAPTTKEAAFISTSFLQLARGIVTGERKPLPPPVEEMEGIWTEYEELAVKQMMAYSFIGDKTTIASGLNDFIEKTKVNELMVTSHIYGLEKRLKSFEILSELMNK